MQTFWSRRDLLGAAAAIVASGSIARAAAPQGRFGGFEVGIQSYSLRGYPTDVALQHAHTLGVQTIELVDQHFSVKSSDAQIAAMKQKTRSLGIKILTRGVDAFTKDHKLNRQYFEFARKAGIRNISADPTEDSFDSLEKLVHEYNIRVAIHNHGPGTRYNKVADVLNAIKGRHELIGACADLGHYIRATEDPVRVIHLLKGRLYGVHLKDFAYQDARLQGVILGDGHLDVAGVFRALRQVGLPPDACLALEYEEKPQDPLDDLKKCLDVAAKAADKAFS